MGKVRKPNQPLLLALSEAAAAAAASAAAIGSIGAETTAEEDTVTASTFKSARVNDEKTWCNESTCCGNSCRDDGSIAMSFDEDDDDRKGAGGANDAASGAEKAKNRAWNFMMERRLFV